MLQQAQLPAFLKRQLNPAARRIWERILERHAAGERIAPIAVQYAREVLGVEEVSS